MTGHFGPGCERRSMKISRIVLTCRLVAGLAPALAACGSSNKSPAGSVSSGTTPSGGGGAIELYSSLPVLGPLTSATKPALNRQDPALSHAHSMPAPFTV